MTLFLDWTLTFVECGSGRLLRICLEVQNMFVSKRESDSLWLMLIWIEKTSAGELDFVAIYV